MVKAIIFDCFGVLVGQGFDHTYEVAGGDPVRDHAFIEDILGQASLGMIPEADFHGTIIKKLGITPDAWNDAMRVAEQPDAKLLDYIKQLRDTYKTAVLSNANRGVLQDKIGAERLKECFDEVVVSAELGMVKPDPEIYRYTAERLNVAVPECVFIDDLEGHLAAARELGMKAILYQSFEQSKTDLEKLLAN